MEQINIDEISLENINLSLSKAVSENGDIIEVLFLYKSNFNNTKILRDGLLHLLKCLNIADIWINRFVLMSDELNNNAIEYGSNENSFNTMFFKFKKVEDKIYLVIEVKDNGDNLKSKKASEMEVLREQRLSNGFENHKSIRGRGLFLIITKLVDKLYFKDSPDGGLVVGIEKIL